MEVDILPSPVDAIRSHKLFRIKNNAPSRSLFAANGTPSQPESRVISKKLSSDYYSESPSPIPEINNGLANKLKRWPSAALTLKQLNRHKNEDARLIESLDKTGGRSKGSTEIQQALMKNFMAQRKANFSVSRKVSNDYDQQFRNASYQERNYESFKGDEDSHKATKKKKSGVSHITSYQTVETEPNSPENDYYKEVRESPLPALILPKIHNRLEPRNLVFAPNVKEHIYRKHAMDVAQGVKYAMKQLKAPPISTLAPKQVSLKQGRNAPSKTLILDLDETLITSKVGENDKEKNIVNIGTEETPIKIMIRPYVKEFLVKMSKEFEVVVFTAADKNYAESVVNFLDPNQKYISHVLHREHCLRTKKGIVIKDLRIIKDRDLRNILIVDNFTPSFSFQIENGIPIVTWKGDIADEELKYLMDYLLEAKTYDDMRVFNRERLRLEELASISADKFAYGNM